MSDVGPVIVNILLSLLPVLIVVIVFVTGFSWYLARNSLTPLRTPKSKTPADFDLPFKDFSVQSNGLTLKGWLIPSVKSQPAPSIVLLHGWGRNAEQMLPHAAYLSTLKVNLVMFDMRGHGDSDPVEFVTINRMTQDLAAVVDHVLNIAEFSAEVGLLGHSMGAAVAILQASQDTRIRALVSSSGFADFKELISQMLHWRRLPAFPFRMLIETFWQRRAGVLLDSVTPVDQIGKITFPVLLVHGEEDSVIPIRQMQRLHEKCASAERFIVTGKGHSGLHEDQTYRDRVLSYFKEQLIEK